MELTLYCLSLVGVYILRLTLALAHSLTLERKEEEEDSGAFLATYDYFLSSRGRKRTIWLGFLVPSSSAAADLPCLLWT